MRSSCFATMSRFVAARRASSRATGAVTPAAALAAGTTGGRGRAARRTSANPSAVVGSSNGVAGGGNSSNGSLLPPPRGRRRPQDRAAARVEALCRSLTADPGERRRGAAVTAGIGSPRSVGDASSLASVASAATPSSSSPSPSLDLPEPRDIRVKTAQYVGSSVTPAGCPRIPPLGPWLPEFALLGRSNVGKSSLVNCLAGRGARAGRGSTTGSGSSASLAMVSSTPGKTATINHFLVNDSWYLVDLPGYGYARKAQKTRCEWAEFTQAYLLERPTLASAFLLADVSVPPQEADVEAAVWMAERNVPFSVVFTKADKRKKASKAPPPEVNAAELEKLLSASLPSGGELPPIFATSSATGAGRKELLAYMSQLRQLCAARWAAEGLDLGGSSVCGGGGAAAESAAPLRRGKDGGAPDHVSDDEWW